MTTDIDGINTKNYWANTGTNTEILNHDLDYDPSVGFSVCVFQTIDQ